MSREECIEEFLRLWNEHPQWRLGQFIENMRSYIIHRHFYNDLFYIPDVELIKKLSTYLDEVKK